MAAYVFRSIPPKVLQVINRQWTYAFLVWLDGAITAITGGGTGPGSWPPFRLMTAASLAAYTYNSTAQTITFNVAGSQSVDGHATVLGDRIWNANGAAGADQGGYVVTRKGAGGVAEVWTRAPDANASAQFLPGKIVETGPDGATLGDVIFELSSPAPIVLDTTAITIAAPTNLVTKSGVQDISGAKSFQTATLLMWNAAKTFKTTLTTLASAARAVVFPDLAGNVVIDAGVRVLSVAGHNGAGACTATGAKVGDKVIGISFSKVPTAAAGTIIAFEAIVTVADQLQQTAIGDLSAEQFMVTVISQT